jgi:hypothetical protein
MPTRKPTVAATEPERGEPWERLELLVPASWKRWLREAATARAMSVGDLVRQCIRALMIQRHEQ